MFKWESGVHRVQRVPATESQGRIHTSTATVAVLPEAEEVEVVLDPKELKIETIRGWGPGGQSVNTTDSAVRVTHLPTGLAVVCQDERSQLQNKERAMRILRARLYEIELERAQSELDEARRSQIGTGARSEKVRTYNYPQSRVTDHRVKVTSHNLQGVLLGELELFTDALQADDNRAPPAGGARRRDGALLIVDVQHDFLPGGALAVTDGDEVIPALVEAAEAAELVVASRDAHPPDHSSFSEQGGIWPVHCVDGTRGAELHPEIAALDPDLVVEKATTRDVDAYSAFDGTGLADELRARGVDRLVVGGLATDYCVRASVLDALREGFAVTVLADGVRGVDVQPGDSERALSEMRAAGATVR